MSSTNRGAVRRDKDFYATPDYAFMPLIPYLAGPIWEPACGDGRLVSWMRDAGLEARGDDLRNGYDFLKDTTKRANIVTNPPFSIAQEFIAHATKLSPNVWLLLRVNFLGAQKRYDFWLKHPVSAMMVLSERPDFTGDGGDSTEYAWFYWGETYKGISHLFWKPPAEIA